MQEHPDASVLAAFMSGRLTTAESSPVLAHLLTECQQCKDAAQTIWSLHPAGVAGDPETEPLAARPELLAAIGQAASQHSHEARSSEQAVSTILDLPSERREFFALNATQCHSLRVVEKLIDHAYSLRFEDVEQLIQLNRLSMRLLEKVQAASDAAQLPLINDFRGRAQSHLGNGFGILRHFEESNSHFHAADRWLAAGTEDPLEKANSLKLRIAARFRQRDFDGAQVAGDRAINLYERCGDQHSVGEVFLILGSMKIEEGKLSEAMVLLDRSLENLDQEMEPEVFLSVRHNRVVLLQELGRTHEALEDLDSILPLYDQPGQKIVQLRLKALQAELAEGLGQVAVAERSWLEARNGFVAAGRAADAAEVSLELALFYLRHGRNQDARRVAKQSLPILKIVGLRDEAVAALLVFRQATLRDQLSERMVRDTLRMLQAARQDSN